MPLLWRLLPCLALGGGLVGCGARSIADRDGGSGDGDSDSDADTDVDTDTGSDTDSGELDLGPDARPSDYPGADDWTDADPAGLGEDEPCCDLVGDPVELDAEQSGRGPPLVDWNGGGWGVAWGPAVYRALDPDAHPLGPPVVIDADSRSHPSALVWGYDRYAMTRMAWRSEWNRVGMVDRNGTVLGGFTDLGANLTGPDIDRYTHGRGWLLAYREEHELGDVVQARWVDDEAGVGGEVHEVATGVLDGPRVVGLKSRASIVWSRREGVLHTSFQWPDVSWGYEEQLILPMPILVGAGVEAVAYRDWVVAAGMGRTVEVVVYDPWEDEVVAGPEIVATSGKLGRPALAAAEERGFIGLCYEKGEGPAGGSGPDGAAFVLVGPDATRWGAEVPVAEDLANIGGCAVGWSGEEFLVLWWEAGGEGHRIFAQRVRPRI